LSILPKILIFTPTYEGKEYCRERFVANSREILKSWGNARHIIIDNSPTLDYTNKLTAAGLDVIHVERGNNSRESLTRAQNIARQIAIDEGYDYLFSLESDIFPPKDILHRLYRRGKKVITGVYLIGSADKGARIPCITLKYFNEHLLAYGTRLLKAEELFDYRNKGVKEVAAGGFGCCLIHRDIFTKLSFRYDPRFMGHSDIYFFNSIKSLKEEVFVDTDIFCEHENSDWTKVTDR
jgi:hypothetical protein